MSQFYKIMPLFILIAMVTISICAPFLPLKSPYDVNMSHRLLPPGPEHILGTDSLGRDVLSRVLHGGRRSLVLAFFATLLAMGIGTAAGFFSGYYGGIVDSTITTVSNIFTGLPGMSIMIALAGILGPGMKSLLIAIVINSWVGFSRIVRGDVLRLKTEPFIEATENIGASRGWIFIRHILPNLSDSLIVLFTAKIGQVLLSVAALSYLGLGLQPPEPDWAIMISDARPYFRQLPSLVVAPGLAIVLFVWSVLSIGDNMRSRFDSREESFYE